MLPDTVFLKIAEISDTALRIPSQDVRFLEYTAPGLAGKIHYEVFFWPRHLRFQA
jgi:hypothetical protein